MAQPLVSIITTTKNRKDLLLKLLDKMREQTYHPFEHIIIDAGSTDGTLDILRKLENKYPVRWISETDKNQTEGVNKGLKLAQGELVAITHDDDYWLPNGLRMLVHEFNSNPYLDLAYGDSFSLFPDQHTERVSYRRYDLADMVNRGYQIPQHGCIFKRSWFDRIGFLDDSIDHVAEYDFFLRLIEQGGRYMHVPEIVCVGLQHDRKESWVCREHAWQETWRVNRAHGGQLLSLFTLLYVKNRYFYGLSQKMNKYIPGVLNGLKRIFKTPHYSL